MSMHELRRLADQDNADAQYQLGELYNNDPEVQDYVQAVEWYRKAVEQGHPEAQYKLGWMHRMGLGVLQDYDEALQCYIKASKQGHEKAERNALEVFYRGYSHYRSSVQKDNAEAVFWIRKAAEQGNVDAQMDMGRMYYEGENVAQDHMLAADWFRRVAEQGDQFAQYRLGDLYYEESVIRNYAQAADWFRKAAEQGHKPAQLKLGDIYCKGLGVTRDYAHAKDWYYKAAEQGDLVAQLNLGRMYEAGQGVARDYVQAYKWLSLAARYDLEEAIKLRNSLEATLTSDQLGAARQLAQEWKDRKEKENRRFLEERCLARTLGPLREAAEKGDENARQTLANMQLGNSNKEKTC